AGGGRDPERRGHPARRLPRPGAGAPRAARPPALSALDEPLESALGAAVAAPRAQAAFARAASGRSSAGSARRTDDSGGSGRSSGALPGGRLKAPGPEISRTWGRAGSRGLGASERATEPSSSSTVWHGRLKPIGRT